MQIKPAEELYTLLCIWHLIEEQQIHHGCIPVVKLQSSE